MSIPTSLGLHLEDLYAIADQIENLLEAKAANLPYVDWDGLHEAAVQLRAYANLVQMDSPGRFLHTELDEARRLVETTRKEAGLHG